MGQASPLQQLPSVTIVQGEDSLHSLLVDSRHQLLAKYVIAKAELDRLVPLFNFIQATGDVRFGSGWQDWPAEEDIEVRHN